MLLANHEQCMNTFLCIPIVNGQTQKTKNKTKSKNCLSTLVFFFTTIHRYIST